MNTSSELDGMKLEISSATNSRLFLFTKTVSSNYKGELRESGKSCFSKRYFKYQKYERDINLLVLPQDGQQASFPLTAKIISESKNKPTSKWLTIALPILGVFAFISICGGFCIYAKRKQAQQEAIAEGRDNIQSSKASFPSFPTQLPLQCYDSLAKTLNPRAEDNNRTTISEDYIYSQLLSKPKLH
ncbi:unnamed protein product [Moneuplotes crassus]|uniref:Uncharacterized protein n=1 Tax=Euplotes crassus TaxID=5936 RepID=A0AAD1UDH2_EUPCR|nr:unnamed protein product [Moneuplotes crassus]